MIPIRSLQHFLYCPHRWGMLYRDGLWQDNAFTVIANLVHERVHSGDKLIQSKSKIALSDVTVFSKRTGVYGHVDCLELIPDEGGIKIPPYLGKFKISIVEYKPTAPKRDMSDADRAQLFAQYYCVRELFSVAPTAYIYYADTRKRTKVLFDESDERVFCETVEALQRLMQDLSTPDPVYGEKCNGCSMRDRCMPKPIAKSVYASIREENA